MRGEHRLGIPLRTRLIGSSPHARGAQHLLRLRGHIRGIIPACAGSTLSGHKQRIPIEDHPRMRGEHGDQNG